MKLEYFVLGMLFMGLVYLFFNPNKIEQFKSMCPEIDELCEQDFIRMCRYSIPEIIGIDTDTYCDRIFEARCEDANCYCDDLYSPNISKVGYARLHDWIIQNKPKPEKNIQ